MLSLRGSTCRDVGTIFDPGILEDVLTTFHPNAWFSCGGLEHSGYMLFYHYVTLQATAPNTFVLIYLKIYDFFDQACNFLGIAVTLSI